MQGDLRIPDYPAPIRAFRIWRVTLEVDEYELMNALSLSILTIGRQHIVPALEVMRPDPVLASWNMGLPWSPDWQQAQCVVTDHAAPQYDCTCGHYAVPSLGYIFGGQVRVDPKREVDKTCHIEISVPGVVEVRGRIIEHEKGFRAEYARPVALLDASRWSEWLTHTGPAFELIAQLYGLVLTPHMGVLTDLVEHPDRFPNRPVRDDNARLLLGGPADGTVLSVAGKPESLNVPTFERGGYDTDGYPVLAPVNAAYDRIGNCSYRYRKEGR